MVKNLHWRFILIAIVVGLAVWRLYPPKETINLGLDLKGGMHIVLEVDTSGLSADNKEGATQRAMEIIRRRIDQFGVSEPSISTQGQNRIVIQLPGVADRERALNLIGRTAQLSFRLVSTDQDKIVAALKPGGQPPAGYQIMYLKQEINGLKTEAPLLVKNKADLTGAHLVDAKPDFGGGFNEPQVRFSLDKEGGKIFATITERYIGRQLAIVLDEDVVSAPRIQSVIPNGEGVITGSFSTEEARDLALVLSAGALPAPVKVLEDRTISPSLGQDSIRSGVLAGVWGFALVLIFILVYYLFGGIVANIALLLNIVLLMGGLAFFGATLTLPGIAGIILTIGMAVDANVLIFERTREELKAGKKVRSAILSGYDKAFLTILDANLTTLLTALVLFLFGSGPVKGFAVTLSLGLIISMFTALYVTKSIFAVVAQRDSFKSFKMLHIFKEQPKVPFVKMRKIALIFSLVLLALGMGSFAMKGKQNFGVDFRGGVLAQLSFEKTISVEAVRDALNKVGMGDSVIQKYGHSDKDVLIRAQTGALETIKTELAKQFSDNPFKVERSEVVGPAVGSELRKDAIIAFVIAIIGIIVYVGWRFEFNFGFATVIAIVHDILICLGAIALTGQEISLPIVAALLAIAGYSVNDTIVVFDRVREDMKIYRKRSFPDIVNMSLNQTLSRTLLTSLTTLFVVTALFLFGGGVIHGFAFVLLVGVLSGTYSTLFIASPLVVAWHKDKKRR